MVQADINEVNKTAHTIKTRLEALDLANKKAITQPVCAAVSYPAATRWQQGTCEAVFDDDFANNASPMGCCGHPSDVSLHQNSSCISEPPGQAIHPQFA